VGAKDVLHLEHPEHSWKRRSMGFADKRGNALRAAAPAWEAEPFASDMTAWASSEILDDHGALTAVELGRTETPYR